MTNIKELITERDPYHDGDAVCKVYISGRITGDPDHKTKFARAAAYVERQGCIALNPAALPEGMTAADYMRVDLAMLDVADAVALLPDYVNSLGAQIEIDYAHYVGKPVFDLPREALEKESEK